MTRQEELAAAPCGSYDPMTGKNGVATVQKVTDEGGVYGPLPCLT